MELASEARGVHLDRNERESKSDRGPYDAEIEADEFEFG